MLPVVPAPKLNARVGLLSLFSAGVAVDIAVAPGIDVAPKIDFCVSPGAVEPALEVKAKGDGEGLAKAGFAAAAAPNGLAAFVVFEAPKLKVVFGAVDAVEATGAVVPNTLLLCCCDGVDAGVVNAAAGVEFGVVVEDCPKVNPAAGFAPALPVKPAFVVGCEGGVTLNLNIGAEGCAEGLLASGFAVTAGGVAGMID